jgi:hypothetical protein
MCSNMGAIVRINLRLVPVGDIIFYFSTASIAKHLPCYSVEMKDTKISIHIKVGLVQQHSHDRTCRISRAQKKK